MSSHGHREHADPVKHMEHTAHTERRGGILLHPTSLPGPHGSGDFGPAAYHFVDWLVSAGQRAWQVLPLTPTGFGNSPYAGVSAFAGSALLVALEPLIERGWLAAPTAQELAALPAHKVDFVRSRALRMRCLQAAAAAFVAKGNAAERAEHEAYCAANRAWLDDFALFMALDESQRAHGVQCWADWPAPLAQRDAAALAAARAQHAERIAFWRFVQWCFDTQWQALKRYANARDVQIIGDLPIFVAHHSADCWARPDLFLLDARGQPRVVAGVPPDYFSATGQRWGNPLYDWAAMQRDGFAWWIARLHHELARADRVRIDHFRGFAAYWEIDATEDTAIKGCWVPAPGKALFGAMKDALGNPAVIAEDLGVITPDVEALRDDFGFPGMRVLQFAFGGDASHPFLPHNYVPNCVAYTGTHDNDTSRGWATHACAKERDHARIYLESDDEDLPWAMVRAVLASVAQLAIVPLQDALDLGSEHRMNTPGQLDCWAWRFTWAQVGNAGERLASYAQAYGRAPGPDRLTLTRQVAR